MSKLCQTLVSEASNLPSNEAPNKFLNATWPPTSMKKSRLDQKLAETYHSVYGSKFLIIARLLIPPVNNVVNGLLGKFSKSKARRLKL